MHSIESEAFSKKTCGQAPLIVIDQNCLKHAIANSWFTCYFYNFSNVVVYKMYFLMDKKVVEYMH